MNIKKNLLILTIRILIGFFFIISAFLKLSSIDSFEIYIYSFGLFKLNHSFLFARLIISFEILAGILLIFNIFQKRVASTLILTLTCFSVFIAYLFFTDNKEDCHCFGDAIQLSHISSFIKNIILIAFLYILFKKSIIKRKHQTITLIFSVILSLSLPLILSPPDNFYTSNVKLNETYLQEFLEKNEHLKKGKQVISFFGTGCKYCKLATKKIKVIINKTSRKELFSYVFWGSEKSIKSFFNKTLSEKLAYSNLQGSEFLRITDGRMPLILLLDKGKVIAKYDYRSINEKEIIDFIVNQ